MEYTSHAPPPDTAEDSCIVNDIHALVLTCHTAFLFFILTSVHWRQIKNKQTSAVRKAKEENQMYKDAHFVHVI